MTLRLRCIRCGDWDEMDPLVYFTLGLCGTCTTRVMAVWDSLEPSKLHRWCVRWRRDQERHPTYRALAAALDAMEATPHGTLVLEQPAYSLRLVGVDAACEGPADCG